MSRFSPARLWLFALAPLVMTPAAAQPIAPAAQCDRAAAIAEREYALPPGILTAIGEVETGRLDPASRILRPWPWSVNAAGEGTMLPTAEAAMARVQALQQRGVQSIDVGCFQVNLLYHPDAFPTLQAAFDPPTNALYAGQFLAALHQRVGNWDAAIMAYHSAVADRGAPYRDKVLAKWSEASGGRDSAFIAAPMAHASAVEVVPVWSPLAPGTAPETIVIGRHTSHTPIIITPSS
jgi:soluble lytic murein transglycosylase-like protein